MSEDQKGFESEEEAMSAMAQAPQTLDDVVDTPAVDLPKEIYLSIVSYVGGQIDNSLKSTAVVNADQFLYAYSEEDKGFVFREFDRPLSGGFTLSRMAKVMNVPEEEDAVINALYNLSDHGFSDADGSPDEIRFLRRLTGQEIQASNKADPRILD